MLRLARLSAAALRHVLLPLAAGHAACATLVAASVVFGVSFDPALLQDIAVGLLIGVVLWHLRRRSWSATQAWRCCRAGIALSSLLMAGAHGTGLMLVPLLAPLCVR